MAVLDVGVLHARYHQVDPDEAAVLDESLRRVAAEGLAEALLDVALPDVHAVCIRSLHVEVGVDPGCDDRRRVRDWSAAIAGALSSGLADARPAGAEARGPGGIHDPVIYRREVDVVLDVVRSTAQGDASRLWAWQQCGAIASTALAVRGADVARALVRRPELIPAVVGAAATDLARVLDLDGWIEVAAALRPLATGARPLGEAVLMAGERSTDSVAHVTTSTVDSVLGMVPARVWSAAIHAGRGELLACLALACAEPTRLGQPGATSALVDAVAAAVAGDAEDRPLGSAGGTDAAGGSGEVPRPVPEQVESARAGVLFLVHGITALDLPARIAAGHLADHDPRTVLAWTLAAATGASLDDPALMAAVGRGGEGGTDDEPALPADDVADEVADEVAGLAQLLVGWLRARLHDVGDEDLDWLWARRAVLSVEPGWIEASFALADTDVRVRAAGLDIDPGYVWWLGAAVRFRYV